MSLGDNGSNPPHASAGRRIAWLALVMGLAAAAYARTIGFSYVWDDVTLLPANPVVRGETPFWQIFTAHYASGAEAGGQGWMYRPLVLLSFRWGWALSPSPTWAHAVNVVLHVLTTALAWAIARRLGASRMAAGLAAAGFALFPANLEAVAWVSGRTDVLAAFFLGGAIFLLTSLAPLSPPRMFAVFLLVAAACLCKENAFLVAPIVALAAGLGARQATGRFTIRPLVSVLAAAAAVAILRVRALGGLGLQPQQGAQLDLGTQVARLGEQLSFAHGFDPRAVMTVAPAGPSRWWMLILVGVTLACVAGAAARWGRRGAWLPAGLLCAAMLALLPVMRLRWPALRYWYVPALCLAPLGGLALTRLLALARPRTVLIPVLALLVSWAAFGQLRMPAWRSDARLFTAEAALQPENPDALFFHAERTALDGRPDLAVPIFEAALARAPGHRPSWLGLARALLSLGRPDAAETVARQSLMGEPRTWPQFMLLGDALARQEKWKDAQGAYDEALARAPLIPDVLMAAAWAARATGSSERAQTLARRALAIDPRNQRARALLAIPSTPN